MAGKTTPAAKPKAKVRAKAKPKVKPRAPGEMTDQIKAFCANYTMDFHGTNAALRVGYSPISACQQASKLLGRQDVQDEVRRLMDKIERKTQISVERAVQEAWGVATADVNELVEFRVVACRHCHGIDYGYQRTVQEMSRDRAAYENEKRKAIFKDPTLADTYEAFDEKGGIGFDGRVPPNPECTACWGKGVGDALFKDTRNLTPAARALYAGVKQTKEGFQMLLVDKLGGLEKVMKHLGAYKIDNEQKADALGDFLKAVQERGGKLPIKGA